MTDIGVYTTHEILMDKIECTLDGNVDEVWWKLSKEPKSLPEKIFFAANGKWRGFFTIEKLRTLKEGMKIYLDEWHRLDNQTPSDQFQGFTYRTPEVV